MIGEFKKTYLHRPVKIPHFLTPARDSAKRHAKCAHVSYVL